MSDIRMILIFIISMFTAFLGLIFKAFGWPSLHSFEDIISTIWIITIAFVILLTIVNKVAGK